MAPETMVRLEKFLHETPNGGEDMNCSRWISSASNTDVMAANVLWTERMGHPMPRLLEYHARAAMRSCPAGRLADKGCPVARRGLKFLIAEADGMTMPGP